MVSQAEHSQSAARIAWLLQCKVITAKACSNYTRATVHISCPQRFEVGGERYNGCQYTIDSFDIAVLCLRQPEVRPK